MAFNRTYFLLFVLLFFIEVLIALFVHDRFVRPYVGDYLVVMLIYCFVKSFFNTQAHPTALGVLLFSYLVETLQYFNFIALIGLQESKTANVVIGNSFSWLDMLAYTLGIFSVMLMEHYAQTHKHRNA